MSFEGFVENVLLLNVGDEVKYWHFKVKYEHTKTLWIYYRGQVASLVHNKNDAAMVLRAMYQTIKIEFE